MMNYIYIQNTKDTEANIHLFIPCSYANIVGRSFIWNLDGTYRFQEYKEYKPIIHFQKVEVMLTES